MDVINLDFAKAFDKICIVSDRQYEINMRHFLAKQSITCIIWNVRPEPAFTNGISTWIYIVQEVAGNILYDHSRVYFNNKQKYNK